MKKIFLLFALLLPFMEVTQVVAQDEDFIVLEISKMTGNWTASVSPAYASEFATTNYSTDNVTPGVRIQHWNRSGGHNNNMFFWDSTNLGFWSGSSSSEDYRIYPSKGYYISSISFDFIPGKHPNYAMNGVRVWFEDREDEAEESPDADNPAHFGMDFEEYEATGDEHYLTMKIGQVLENGNSIFAHTYNFQVTLTKRDSLEVLLNDIIAFVEEVSPYTLDGDNAFITGTGVGNYGAEEVAAFNAAYVECIQKIDDPTGMEYEYEEYKASYDNLRDAYEAVLASQVTLTLTDGYYRFRTAMNYTDGAMKYMYAAYADDVSINGKWGALYNQADSCLALWQLTQIEEGVWDIVNVATDARLNEDPKTMSPESDIRFALEYVATIDNNTYINIRRSDVATGQRGYLHQMGHQSGAGTSGDLYFWNPSYSGKTMGASEWVIEPVDNKTAAALIEAYASVKKHKQLVREFKMLLAESLQFLEESKGNQDEALINNADQFSSPWTETSEGVGRTGDYGLLLDGDPTTFWHSDWSSGSVDSHRHYLQVALNEPVHDLIRLQITRRPTLNDHITLWGVYGSNDADAYDEEWTELASLSTPYGSNSETIRSAFFAPQGYQFLRFYIDETTTNRGFGHVAEFQLLRHVVDSAASYTRLGNVATDFEARLLELSQIAVNNYTRADLEDLRNAYEAYVQACDELGEYTPEEPDPTPEDPDPKPEDLDPTTDRWPNPVPPTMPTRAAFDGNWVTPEVGHTYYIYNVEAAQFMGCGRDWGTRTITTTDSIASPTGAQIKHGTDKNFVLPFNIESDGGDYVYIRSFITDQSNTYVTALSDGNASWYDGDAARAAHWQIVPVEDNVFLLHDAIYEPYDPSAYDEENLDSEDNDIHKYSLLGVTDVGSSASYTWTDCHPGVTYSGVTYKVGWKFLPASDETAQEIRTWIAGSQETSDEAMEAYRTALSLYKAKLTLRNTMMEAVEVNVDVTEAESVYLSKTATEADVRAANTTLLLTMRMKDGDYPIDITGVLQNPDFEEGDYTGWETNYEVGLQVSNFGFQGMSFSNGEIQISNFMEAWKSGDAIGDGFAQQIVYGLPAGVYRLECDAISSWQSSTAEVTGVSLFIESGILERKTSLVTGYRSPEHFEVEFYKDGNNALKFGWKTENATANWVAVDNFKLWMTSPSPQLPSYAALLGEVNIVAGLLEKVELDELVAEQTVVDNLKSVYNEVEPLVDATPDTAKDEVYNAAYAALNDTRNALLTSEAEYKKIAEFLETRATDLTKYDEKAGYGDVVAAIEAFFDDLQTGYDERTLTSDAITSAIEGYAKMIKDAIQAAFNDAVATGKPLDEGLDITPLFEHMSYAWGTSQVSFPNGYPAEDPVWLNETKTGNFKTNYSTAEVWNASPFNIYREFNGLPKGKYTIKVHALYRVKADPGNYEEYWSGSYDDPDYAWLYANHNKVHVTNVAEMATSTRMNLSVEVTDPNTGETAYLVNSQSGAYKLFTDPAYAEAAEKGYIGVSANVVEDGGTFTVGIRGTRNLEDSHWVTWYNFELYYDGIQESLDEDLMALLDELNELEDEQVGSRVVATVNLMEDAKTAGEAAIGQKVDVQTAAILQLQNAIKTAKESEELSLTVMNLVDEYQNRLNDMEVKGTFTDMRIQEILEEILAGLDMGEIESNEQIQGWIAALPEAMLNFILSMEELNEATMENPVEVPIIYNPDYTLGSNHYEGWTLETTATGGNIGKYYDSGYLEFWNNSPVGSQWIIYQDLAKLKEGYYRLQVDGLYRAAGSAGDIQNLKEGEVKYDEYLFAGEMRKPVIAWTDFENGALLGTLAELHETEGYENIDGTEYWYEKAPNESVCFVVPNSCAQMRTFADAGRYQNTLDFGYKEGSVRIGMKALTTYANNWSPFGSWKLFYLGTTYEGPDPTPEYPDPITHKLPDPVSPTMPTRAAFDGDWVTPEAGYTYYIYNEGAAQFMGCGRDWGTRTITTTDSIASPTGAQIRHGANKNFVLPFNIESDGGGYLYIRSFRTDQAYTYVTALAEEENKSWYDGNAARAAHWQLLPVGDNAFLLHDALIDPYDANAYVEDDPETDENEQDAVKSKYSVLGIDAVESASYTWTDAWVGVNASGKSYKVTWKFVEASDDVAMSIRAWREETQADLDEAMKVYNNLLAIYNAKLTLRTTIEAAERASLDVTDAEAIYNSETATEAEVLAANGALLLAIAIQGTTPPVDITNALVNPDFEDGNINGWETNYVSGKQAQNIGCEGSTFTNGEITISGFFVSWISAPATIGDGYLQQTIYGLPAGKYRLECDAIAVQQSNESDTTTGAYLFIQSGTGESKTSMTTGNREPEHFEVSFNNVGGMPLTFGVKTVSTSANWIGADNFKLWYEGELTESPHYIQLKNYLAQVQDQYSSEDLGNAYLCSDSLTALNNAMTVADNISTSASDVECDAAYAALEKAMSGVLTSIKVYETLLPYTSLNEEGSKLAYYEEVTANNNWYELSEQLHNDQEAFDNAYEEGTWSDDEVVANIDGILPSMITWVQDHPEALQPGNDLTMLLINADFEDGEYNAGWDAKDDEVQPDNNYGTLPGWTISSGNITRMNHVIETYHRKFDFNQTIENMPAGVYDISVQGFVRHDGSATDQTLFYAGDLETPLMQRSDQWSATVLYDPNTMGRPCGDNFGDQTFWNSRGEEVWLPNGMSGFYFWEMVENTEGAYMDYLKWKEGDLYYTNHLRVYLAEPAELTIGLKCLVNTDWIMWDNFRIKYLGGADNLYAEMAAEKFEELNRVYENDNNQMFLTEQAMAEYSEIAIFDYTTINSLEAYQDYSEQCDSLINYIQEGTQLGQGLYTLIMDYEYRCWSTEVDMNDFMDEYISEYMDRLDTGGTFADNNAYRAVPELLAKGWTKCVQKQAEEMLFGNNTPVIYNAKYRDYEDDSMPTLKGWSLEKADSVTLANYYANEGVAEVYAPSGEYTHYQTLVGLQPGYYRVTMDGFFRPGEAFNSIDPEAYKAMKRAYLFGESNVQRVEKPLKNVLEGAQDWEIGVGSERRFRLDDAETGESRYVFTPNNMAAACAYFENVFEEAPVATDLMNEDIDQSVYRNTITLEVGEDSVLTIGISNVGMGYHVRDWVCFSNWTLSYMGTERPSDMPEEEEPEEPEGLLGDVNGDGSVDVVDITTVVDFILEKAVPTAAERTRADVNKDASIDVVDLTTIVSIILETYTPTSNVTRAPARRDASVATDVLTMSGADISLDNLRSYVACQMDVTLADGATLKGVELSDRAIGFSKSYSKIADNTYRVVVYSLGNEPFEGCEGTLLKLNILGDQYSSISNALFTDGHKAYRLEVADIVDGVNGITPSSSKRGAEIFSLSGQKLNRLQKGVNIVNGKKVQVK